MGKLAKFFGISKQEKETWSQSAAKAMQDYKPDKIEASFYGQEYSIVEEIFDGEKTQGELGAPLSYIPSYQSLSYRSWQAYTESDLAQIIVKAHVNWVVGSGLKLQSEPIDYVIEQEGFAFDKEKFTKDTEFRFRLFAKTNDSVFNGMMNFNKLQRIAYLNAAIGGDVLCILRISDNGLPNMQLIDGIFIQTPGMDKIEAARKRGNEIIHGIEVDKDKRHIRYYIANKEGGFTEVEAKGKKSGREVAFMFYGSDYRIDSVRGMPLLSAVLEKMKKLDRYNEAIVGGAEERAKVPWTFEHDQHSTGENPDLSKLGSMLSGDDTPEDSIIVDMTKQTTAIKRTFEKEPYNLPVGTVLKKLDSGMEKDQDAFTTGNFIYICAALETPYEVALMKYVNSFSSSRMASQSFLFILHIKRTLFNDGCLGKFYNLFLDMQILTGKIKAEGYFTARNKKDVILLQAYRNARFTGPGVPQADPGREVKAEVEKIKNNLSTHEQAIERLNGGDDFDTIVDKLGTERKRINEVMPKEEIEGSVNNGGAD
ncbi:phage portal protein [Candidatus Pacearchaeota archaeon]|nr:phage portal protein [Candidatus Pacearchaeota archaeon]